MNSTTNLHIARACDQADETCAYSPPRTNTIGETLSKHDEHEDCPPVGISFYDAGLLNDFGGGNVDWWQDYIRAELGRAHDHYEAQFDNLRALDARTAIALKWCAAALQALVDSRGESGAISMIVSGEKKSLEEVLDMADVAIARTTGANQ